MYLRLSSSCVATAEGCVAQRGAVYLKCITSLEVNYSPPRSICAAAEDIKLEKLLK